MLFFYFLRHLYTIFSCTVFFLVFIFSSCNLFLRLSAIKNIKAITIVFSSMIPLVAGFAFPLAAGFAVHFVIGSLKINGDMLFLLYSRKSLFALQKAVFIFALTLTLFYVPLMLEWIPSSYLNAKQHLAALAQETIISLEDNVLHEPFVGFNIFFKKKTVLKKEVLLESLFLSRGNQIFLAKKGLLKNNNLVLLDGSSYYLKNVKNPYITYFKRASIDIDEIINKKTNLQKENKSIKFYSFFDIVKNKSRYRSVLIEFHRRLSCIIWFFLYSFISLLMVFLLPRNRGNAIQSLFSSGLLFLVMHLFVTAVKLCNNCYVAMLFVSYAPAFIISLVFLFYVKKRGITF